MPIDLVTSPPVFEISNDNGLLQVMLRRITTRSCKSKSPKHLYQKTSIEVKLRDPDLQVYS